MVDSMIPFEILILPSSFLFVALFFVILGYAMGRKTITDTPLIKKRHNPRDNKDPEQSEIMRCLGGGNR